MLKYFKKKYFFPPVFISKWSRMSQSTNPFLAPQMHQQSQQSIVYHPLIQSIHPTSEAHNIIFKLIFFSSKKWLTLLKQSLFVVVYGSELRFFPMIFLGFIFILILVQCPFVFFRYNSSIFGWAGHTKEGKTFSNISGGFLPQKIFFAF